MTMKERHLNKWADISCSRIGRLKKDICSPQNDLQIECNLNQNPNRLPVIYLPTGFKIYMKRKMTYNNQNNFEKEKQSWMNHTT